MAKLKKVVDKFYFLAETEEERKFCKLLRWDKEKKAYFTPDFIRALKIKNALKDIKICEDTAKFFNKINDNHSGSYAMEPLQDMRIPQGDLFNFQVRGIQEMILRLHAYKCVLLSDEQGLGKTAQSAKVVADIILHFLDRHIPNNNRANSKILIVCPASLKLNWQKELFQWCNAIYAKTDIQVIGSSKDWIGAESQIVIVNYDLVTKEHIRSQIEKAKFYVCVCDEAHYLKNAKALRTKAVAAIMKKMNYNIALTGTPVLNKPVELYSLLKCLGCLHLFEPYGDYRSFAFRYCNAFEGMWGMDVSGASNLEELNLRLRSTIMIRREKKDVLTQLPNKMYQIIPLEADKKAKNICDTLSKLDIEQLKEKPELGSVGEIAKLRHELALAKIDQCIDYIKEILESKQKLVLFAHHREIISKLSEVFKEFNCVIFDGSCNMKEKNEAVEKFQNDQSCRVFIGQIQSAGVGITLTAADTVVFVESSWVPGEVEQAIDRCHRIGQKNNVLAQFLTISGSIDEIMLLTIVKKKKVINLITK